ncbi:amidase [Ramlibacter tataouinensis]|uniref:Amidase n=1 Tax=Ramlibacter tataouinensis TaxID=94132 RepID=A0A127JZB2_9BURK|nr:amidase [Ramlibacter tataouinensis]AMO25173.1 amidase [Ramlibacter tataouinensis]
MSPPSRPDLHTTREALRRGAGSAAAELELSIDIARSAACEHAFLKTGFDEARRLAADPATVASPLMGLAVSVKDLFDVRGETTAAGSLVLAGAAPAAQDCPPVARLHAAGAGLLGRTNMSEFAFSGVGINPHFGTPANPADPTVPRIPGGSSSGAAVSVATGAAFIGLGSDTNGSIRIPAALCGIVGFKNTARRVPTEGALPLSTTLDTVCAMTRSVRDAILAHEILADRKVPLSDVPLAGLRLAVARAWMLDGLEAPVALAFDRALAALRDAGARVEEIELAPMRDLGAILARGTFAGAESYAWHRDLLAKAGDRYDPRVRFRIEQNANMKAYEYVDLLQARRQWIARITAGIEGFDAVLSPTVPIVAPPLAQVAPGAERDAEFFRVNTLLLRNTSVVNMLDGCAISIPCHTPGELPVGLMIWQSAMRDDTVLNVARQAEAALAEKHR